MRNAAIYARVSSERQKQQNTIASQTALLREHAQENNYRVIPEWLFEDEGYSGSNLNRPALERLRDLVASGQIEAVLVYAPDRLSRKYAYQILLQEEFSHSGVETHFLKSAGGDTPEERMFEQFQGVIAEYERAQIAERSRRGKRHRAQAGCVNVLSGAPYGYRYVNKTDLCHAHYAVIESEAETVRDVFALYTQKLLSIGAIVRELNDRGVPTRLGKSPWERSTIWGMLRNPAYHGKACFGKTERCERQRVTKPLRAKGGYSPRSSANRQRPVEQRIEIPVPALVSTESFTLAQERLEENKRLSARRTKVPTLLQGILVCAQCGYNLYRTSTKTTKRQVIYYRCTGSDRHRHLRGPVCTCRPIRQDYLDELVWGEAMEVLNNPHWVQSEIDRRLHESLSSDPVQQRKERLEKERTRVQSQIDKLLDAYQEELLGLSDLRERVPELRRRQASIEKELEGVALQALEKQRLVEMGTSLESFLARLRNAAQTLEVTERQKIIRLIVKQIVVDRDTLKIQHCLPLSGSPEDPPGKSCPLCTRGHLAVAGKSLPALCV
jgi:site-specific DNA recombinase